MSTSGWKHVKKWGKNKNFPLCLSLSSEKQSKIRPEPYGHMVGYICTRLCHVSMQLAPTTFSKFSFILLWISLLSFCIWFYFVFVCNIALHIMLIYLFISLYFALSYHFTCFCISFTLLFRIILLRFCIAIYFTFEYKFSLLFNIILLCFLDIFYFAFAYRFTLFFYINLL